jgi:hypothetical protein
LTKKEYLSALGILEERDVRHEHEGAELAKRLKGAEKRADTARKEGVAEERARTMRLMRGKDKQIASLHERIEQLKKGNHAADRWPGIRAETYGSSPERVPRRQNNPQGSGR